MVRGRWAFPLLSIVLAWTAVADQTGGIRGIVYDADFDAPMPAAEATIAELGLTATSQDGGSYLFVDVPQGTYTLIFSKDGYARQIRSNVVVTPGRMTELDVRLSGEFVDMDEFVVQDLQMGAGTEAALLDLRMESPSLMDSISSDLMSQAGAGDAASALRLVSGATVEDGKYAVVRGLPDRYVNSQMNGVRLPTADADKRAVQLDLFPSAIIESIRVSKTFMPDQQGDASGGAVNVVLKGIPEQSIFKIDTGTSFNTQTRGKPFLTYRGGGVNFLGKSQDDIPWDAVGTSWRQAVGASESSAPLDYKWSIAGGGKQYFGDDITVGGFGSLFYERSSSSVRGGINDKYWVETPGAGMSPQYVRGTPAQGDFRTQLFDMWQSSEAVNWGGLGGIGLETERHALTLLYMYTRTAESKATLGEDTRGKSYYFPGYDRDDPTHPGNQELDAAPYIRTETLEYTERTASTVQLKGNHVLPFWDLTVVDLLMLQEPELEWGVSTSSATLYQPDKRQFGSAWLAPSFNPGFPPWVPAFTTPPTYIPYKPAANFTVGNVQHIWKEIREDSDQFYSDLKLPFEQWTGDQGYFKLGIFRDTVNRTYNQESFSNFNDNTGRSGNWNDPWSEQFPYENHPITAGQIDVDYKGHQNIAAWYYMLDLPLSSYFNVIGGARYETTELSIINDAESDVTWIPLGASGPVALNPGDADVSFRQDDMLPALGFVFRPWEQITLKGSYSETIARQTFKELSPIQQQEYLGGDVFIGNPYLRMSSLKNYDLRLDYTPYDGGLLSLSWFKKDVTDPIEYIQQNAGFTFTRPVNYPRGQLNGIEIETRQQLVRFWDGFEGLALGANLTLIESEVTLPDDEAAEFDQPNIAAPMRKRHMTNAPERLYNVFMTYDITPATALSLFYTVRGDTLIAGAGQSSGKFVPSVYETEYGTLNLGLTHKFGDTWNLKFQAKNLLDPQIETVYRSKYIGPDVTKTSYRKGLDFSIGISATF